MSSSTTTQMSNDKQPTTSMIHISESDLIDVVVEDNNKSGVGVVVSFWFLGLLVLFVVFSRLLFPLLFYWLTYCEFCMF